MKIVKQKEAVAFENSRTCKGIEYPLNDKDINFSIATITGRYPEEGYCTNLECKELIYCLEGKGELITKEEKISFQKGDCILIQKGEVYYWEGNCEIIMPCIPAWYPEQHKLVD